MPRELLKEKGPLWVDGILVWEYTGSQTHKGQG